MKILDGIKDVIEYKDGNLFWKNRKSRKDLCGKVAGSISSSDGYVYIKYQQNRILAHRIVFFLHHGFVPKEIDHINRVRHDNRIENLREAPSHSLNLGNQSIQKRQKTSSYKGVCWDANRCKWRSYIKHEGKKKFIGRHKEEREAAAAYDEAAKKIFGSFANLNLE